MSEEKKAKAPQGDGEELIKQLAQLGQSLEQLQQASLRHTLSLQVITSHMLVFEKLLFTLLPEGSYPEYAARIVEVTNLSAAAMMSPKASEALRGAIDELINTPFSFQRGPEETEPEPEQQDGADEEG